MAKLNVNGKVREYKADPGTPLLWVLRGVAARYPAFDAAVQRPVNLAGRINLCRSRHQQAEPLAPESQELLSLESHVAIRSRGMPVAPADDARLRACGERGRQLYRQRIGQLDLSRAPPLIARGHGFSRRHPAFGPPLDSHQDYPACCGATCA